ncbi:MAG: hypothetical protein KGO49_06740 [Gammaproteobacteria bacterium]|nr:hypothetical protein [Gammaproteobacteria bacterium]
MTCHQRFILIALIAFVLAICLIRDSILFSKYCTRIAKLEGREDERHSLTAPEGGMNWFEIEHTAKLWRRYYRKFDDPFLLEIGNTLFRRGFFNLVLMILLILNIVSVKIVGC